MGSLCSPDRACDNIVLDVFSLHSLNRATSSASPFVGSLNEEDTASHDGFSMKDGIDKVIFKLKMAKKQKEETPKRGAEIPVIGQASQESSSAGHLLL